MKRRIRFTALALAALVAAGAHVSAAAKGKGKREAVRFRVRIENVSCPEGFAARDGARWPFALSPGLYALDAAGRHRLFRVGHVARANGLEAQAEEGNPAPLAASLAGAGHALHGVFDTPVGAAAPGPAGPGAAFEFTFEAAPGMRLAFVTMFGQSNDLFYATARPVELFDGGRPLSGDITARVALFDAGTEVNEEPGVGPHQAPRQQARDTGAPERKRVGPVADGYSYPPTREVIRVTITPEK